MDKRAILRGVTVVSSIDVDRPIRVLLRQAERRFDEKILALSSPEEREHHAQMQAAPAAYAWGQLVAAFNQVMDNFARAFQVGKTDYMRTVQRPPATPVHDKQGEENDE